MKKLKVLLVLLLIYLGLPNSTPIRALTNTGDDVAVSFKVGSSRTLAKYFNQGVELNINGNQGDYSQNQAELVMRDFFKKFPPNEFSIIQSGGFSGQIVYYLGSYLSDNVRFRILIKGIKDENLVRIYSLDIIKQ